MTLDLTRRKSAEVHGRRRGRSACSRPCPGSCWTTPRSGRRTGRASRVRRAARSAGATPPAPCARPAAACARAWSAPRSCRPGRSPAIRPPAGVCPLGLAAAQMRFHPARVRGAAGAMPHAPTRPGDCRTPTPRSATSAAAWPARARAATPRGGRPRPATRAAPCRASTASSCSGRAAACTSSLPDAWQASAAAFDGADRRRPAGAGAGSRTRPVRRSASARRWPTRPSGLRLPAGDDASVPHPGRCRRHRSRAARADRWLPRTPRQRGAAGPGPGPRAGARGAGERPARDRAGEGRRRRRRHLRRVAGRLRARARCRDLRPAGRRDSRHRARTRGPSAGPGPGRGRSRRRAARRRGGSGRLVPEPAARRRRAPPRRCACVRPTRPSSRLRSMRRTCRRPQPLAGVPDGSLDLLLVDGSFPGAPLAPEMLRRKLRGPEARMVASVALRRRRRRPGGRPGAADARARRMARRRADAGAVAARHLRLVTGGGRGPRLGRASGRVAGAPRSGIRTGGPGRERPRGATKPNWPAAPPACSHAAPAGCLTRDAAARLPSRSLVDPDAVADVLKRGGTWTAMPTRHWRRPALRPAGQPRRPGVALARTAQRPRRRDAGREPARCCSWPAAAWPSPLVRWPRRCSTSCTANRNCCAGSRRAALNPRTARELGLADGASGDLGDRRTARAA